MEIVADADTQVLARKAGTRLSSLIAQAGNEPLLMLFSSGSALEMLAYVTLPEDTSHLTLGVLDERFTKNPKENNCTSLKETTFYKNAVLRGACTIDTSMRFERVETLAETMNTAWNLWIEKNPTGKVLVTLGMGIDGHTAGIMPYEEDPGMFDILFEDSRSAVVGYDARGKNPIPLRATVTLPFLRTHINAGVAYVTGIGKESAIRRLLAQNGTYAETPARVFNDIPALTLFTDIIL